MRPSFEDLVGAGVIISYLTGTRSPEAQAAVAAFERARSDLPGLLRECGSGRELIERGSPRDVDLAVELNASNRAPLLQRGAYTAAHA